MGMRYAGFMAGAREDRLIREKREEEEAIREESWQRQVERDDKAHERQLELLDIRNKNAIKLSGINAAKAQRAAATKLKKQVDAVIATNNLNDTPALRAEIANGLTLYGLKDYMSGLKTGEIRFNNAGTTVQQDNPDTTIPTPEAVEAPTVDPVTVTPDTAPTTQTAPTVEQQTDSILSDNTSTPSVDEQTEAGLGSPDPVVSYNNLPYIKIEDFAGQDANQLAQSIRLLKSKGYKDDELAPLREELEFVKAAEQEPINIPEMIGEADTFGKLNALQARLYAEAKAGTLPVSEYNKYEPQILLATEKLIEVRRADAEKDGTQLMFFPITSTGTIGADGQMVTQKDGAYVDAAGNRVDISTGKLLPVDGYETFVRNYNVQSQKVANTVSDGVNAVQSLANYRQLVIDAPAGLNKYISVAGKLVGEINSIKSALQGVQDGTYGYETFENRVMSAIRDLSQDDARIARAQLRAAYTMAAFSGSSGQALSDRELVANLEAVGKGLTDPRKVVGLINDNIDDVVTMTEQRRSTAFDSFIASDTLRETMSQTPIGMNFSNYLDTGVIDEETRRQYLDALANKTDYSFSANQDPDGPPTISQMTFDEFKADLQQRAPEVYDSYTEDKLREFFLSEGGQI